MGLIKRIFYRVEGISVGLTIFLMALFPTLEVFARKFFKTGVPNSTFYTQHLVFMLTFLAAMVTAREKKHLSLSLDLALPVKLKQITNHFVGVLSVTITTALAFASISFLMSAIEEQMRVWIVPGRLFMAVMSISFIVMAVRFTSPLTRRSSRLIVFFLGTILGFLISLPSLENLFMGLSIEQPEIVNQLTQMMGPLLPSLSMILIVLLLVLVAFGTPIFVLMGGIAFLLFIREGMGGEIIPNEAYSMLIDNSVPAIPLFAIAGFILSESKAGERLVRLFRSLFGWFPGGLAVMAILVSTFFTTFTGASGVTILALGALLSVVLINGKYDRPYSLGLLTSSGSIGLLFPPSLPIIIYGISAQVSIKDMFIGGIFPGVVMVSVLIIYSVVYSKRKRVPTEQFDLGNALVSIKESIWEILLPVVIILSYFGGLTTLVESSAIAVIYAFIVEVFIKRDLKLKQIMVVIDKAVPIIGGVLIILAVAKGLSYYIVDAQIPMKLSEWVAANINSKLVFLLLLNLALLVTGCLMDIFSAIIVVVPLILPLGAHFGIHPVHLGVVFLANMELGYLTPPVGLNLFLASYRFNEPLAKIYRHVIPFLIIQLIAVLIITYVPAISTGLLSLFN